MSAIDSETARPALNKYAALDKSTLAKRKRTVEPEVGIFFVYEGHLFIDATPVSEAESCGDFKGHIAGHPSFWQTLQRTTKVPTDVEYDEIPRGRVGFDTKQRKFSTFADPCILKDKRVLNRIQQLLKLPLADSLPPQLDSHYRCPRCTKSKKQREQEAADWDL